MGLILDSSVVIAPERGGDTVEQLIERVVKLAGKIDGEQQSQGVVIPFGDLLIGATALSLGFSVLTANLRHFQKIPGLTVVQL